jgi:hypothetical protein
MGEFSCRERPAGQQGDEDIGARRIADEGRDFCDLWCVRHDGNMCRLAAQYHTPYFGRGRSVFA